MRHDCTVIRVVLLGLVMVIVYIPTGISLGAQEGVRAVSLCSQMQTITPGRLEIPNIRQPLKLAESNMVQIKLQGPELYNATASWNYYDEGGGFSVANRGGGQVAVKYGPNQSTFVEITPALVGRIRLGITLCFKDGEVGTAETDADVVLPENVPDSMVEARSLTGSGVSTGTIYLDMSEKSKNNKLVPMAVYKELENPAPIPVESVRFKVISAATATPPLRIDNATGKIIALHVGYALVQTSFKGLSSFTCIDIRKDIADWNDRTSCSELRPAGMAESMKSSNVERKIPRVKPHKDPED